MNTLDSFRLDDKVCVITGGAGFLGVKHAEALLDAGAIVILVDIDKKNLDEAVNQLSLRPDCKSRVRGFVFNITNKGSVNFHVRKIWFDFGPISILINNAANAAPMGVKGSNKPSDRLETFPLSVWDADIAVNLTGAYLMSKEIGKRMAQNGGGVILNISSDLGLIGPDQRIYEENDRAEENQPKKPITYSVTKHGLIGLTKYLATYWADKGVRVNTLCPASVFNNQSRDFVGKLVNLIPLGRMSNPDEFKGAVVFLCSDASSYMTGATLVMDGGRTCW